MYTRTPQSPIRDMLHHTSRHQQHWGVIVPAVPAGMCSSEQLLAQPLCTAYTGTWGLGSNCCLQRQCTSAHQQGTLPPVCDELYIYSFHCGPAEWPASTFLPNVGMPLSIWLATSGVSLLPGQDGQGKVLTVLTFFPVPWMSRGAFTVPQPFSVSALRLHMFPQCPWQ